MDFVSLDQKLQNPGHVACCPDNFKEKSINKNNAKLCKNHQKFQARLGCDEKQL